MFKNWYIYNVYITQITNFSNNISSNEYTFKLCSIFQDFPWWLHGSEHPMYSLCSLQTYIMYLIKYLAIAIYFSVMSNKLLPYYTIPEEKDPHREKKALAMKKKS